jgi:hypothetical protein
MQTTSYGSDADADRAKADEVFSPLGTQTNPSLPSPQRIAEILW